MYNIINWREIIDTYSRSNTDHELCTLTAVFLQNQPTKQCTVTKSFKSIHLRNSRNQSGIIEAIIKQRDELQQLSRQQRFDMTLKKKYTTHIETN